MIKKAIAVCLIAVSLALAGCGAAQLEKSKFVPADNVKVVETQTEDLNGDGNKEKVALYVASNEQGMPAWKLVVDDFEMVTLDSQDGAYTLADFKLQDVDGEKGLEILCYRYNTGSAAGQGLNVYKYDSNDWRELFNVPNTFDMGKDRFAIKYLGDYRVGFEDQATGLKHTIELDKSLYTGSEESLEGIDTWVDPISEYRFADADDNGISEITSIQRVIGIAHADTIAIWQTTYRLDGEYLPVKVALVDIEGKVLADKNI